MKIQTLSREWNRSHLEIYFLEPFIIWDNIDFKNKTQQTALHIFIAPQSQKFKLAVKELYWKQRGASFCVKKVKFLLQLCYLIPCTAKPYFSLKSESFWTKFLSFLSCKLLAMWSAKTQNKTHFDLVHSDTRSEESGMVFLGESRIHWSNVNS